MKKYVFSFILISSSLFSMQPDSPKLDVPNFQINGESITRENALALISAIKISKAASWLQKHEELLKKLAANAKPIQEWPKKQKTDLALLQTNRLPNLSNLNYIFETTEGIVKIAGLMRLFSMYKTQQGVSKSEGNFWADAEYRNKILGLLPAKGYETHQTISRALNTKLLQDYAAKNNFSYITVPSITIISLTNDNSINDTDLLVVTPKLENLTLLKEYSKKCEIPQQALEELIASITDVGIWDLRNNLFINDKGKLVILDFEQPADTPASHFFYNLADKTAEGLPAGTHFHNAQIKYYLNVWQGLERLVDIFKDCPEQLKKIHTILEENSLFKSGLIGYSAGITKKIKELIQ